VRAGLWKTWFGAVCVVSFVASRRACRDSSQLGSRLALCTCTKASAGSWVLQPSNPKSLRVPTAFLDVNRGAGVLDPLWRVVSEDAWPGKPSDASRLQTRKSGVDLAILLRFQDHGAPLLGAQECCLQAATVVAMAWRGKGGSAAVTFWYVLGSVLPEAEMCACEMSL
jgi:hypothetical protein